MNRTRALLLVAAVPLVIVIWVLVAAALDSGGGGDPRRPGTDGPFAPPGSERIEVGQGARGATVFRPRDADGPGPVVVFLHGWTAVDPELYGRWITHLVEGGNSVIVPTYQERPFDNVVSPLGNALFGIQEALGAVDLAPGRLVVAGHSAGGALAVDYAASARAAGLPPAAAVFSVYPGRTLPGAGVRMPRADARQIPAGTPLLVLAGADDRLVGDRVARQIARTATRAKTTLRIVRDPAVDDHAGPVRAGPEARRQFWAPLDRLIAATA